jgi:hypothetical protein
MYYLAIVNLDMERCIDRNIEDIYEDDQYYSCQPDFRYVKTRIVKQIKIRCLEVPELVFNATVYSD